MELQLFAIRHKPTGRYLPVPHGRGGRGGSHVEPVPATELNPPRTFHTRHAANCALGQWLRGKVTVVVSSHHTQYDGPEYDEDWHLDPVPSRVREEMEVVPLRLGEPSGLPASVQSLVRLAQFCCGNGAVYAAADGLRAAADELEELAEKGTTGD